MFWINARIGSWRQRQTSLTLMSGTPLLFSLSSNMMFAAESTSENLNTTDSWGLCFGLKSFSLPKIIFTALHRCTNIFIYSTRVAWFPTGKIVPFTFFLYFTFISLFSHLPTNFFFSIFLLSFNRSREKKLEHLIEWTLWSGLLISILILVLMNRNFLSPWTI